MKRREFFGGVGSAIAGLVVAKPLFAEPAWAAPKIGSFAALRGVGRTIGFNTSFTDEAVRLNKGMDIAEGESWTAISPKDSHVDHEHEVQPIRRGRVI